MDYAVSKARLINYFSTVTYIDDKFDHCIIDEPIDYGNEEIEDTPPLPVTDFSGMPVDAGIPGIDTHIEEADSEFNLSTILTALNSDKYAGVRFTPVLFKDNIDKDILVRKIQESPLTLIDWNLGAREKAFDFINRLFETTKQLKVIVVYTGNYVEAIGAMKQDQYLKDCLEINANHGNFSCFRCNNQSLLAIADKKSYNLEKLLDIISDVFINNCGLMPVAVLDYMASAQRVSDELFGSFCHPFEDIYWLQMYFSELSEADITDSLAGFIQNKFYDYCGVDLQITEELFLYHKNRLRRVIQQGEKEASETIKICWEALNSHLSGFNKEFCEVVCSLEFKEFKECCENAIENSMTWNEFLKAFDPILNMARKQMAEKQCNDLLTPYSNIPIPEGLEHDIGEHRRKLQDYFYKQIATSYKEFKEQIFPIFIQSLISSTDILFAGVELVKNLKYRIYDNPNLHKLLGDGKAFSKTKKAAFLKNKIHFGDILVKENEQKLEYLLCITPPCDIFRPEKINLNVNFIRGEELEESSLNTRRKENVHVSILPVIENGEEKLKYVSWQLYGVVNFNMNQEDDYEKLCSYSRPLRMSEQYARQIANTFTAYFSRAGVDELFMKAAGNLRTIFN